MAINATKFTQLNEHEDAVLKGAEKEVDDLLDPAIEAAKQRGHVRFDFRYPPAGKEVSLSPRVWEMLHQKYRNEGWTVGWTNFTDRTGLYLRAVVSDRRK